MINAVLALGILGLSFPSSLSKVTPDSVCPMMQTCENFDVFRFQGSWFKYGVFRSIRIGIPSAEEICSIITFTVDHGAKVMVVDEAMHDDSNKNAVTDLQAFIPDLTDPSKWELGYPGAESVGDFWILDTDYVNYAVTLLCQYSDEERPATAWIITRERHPSKIVINTAFFSAYQFGFTRKNISLYNHQLC